MAGYVRQSSAQIAANEPITSAAHNNEYNALQTAFAASGGHTHDGSVGGGSPIAYSSLTGTPTIPQLSTATPQALGTAAAGAASTSSRADHVHPMPTYTDVGAAPTSHTHANATDSVAGFQSAADKTKLDGLQTAYGAGIALTTGTLDVTSVVARRDADNDFTGHTLSDFNIANWGQGVAAVGTAGSQNLDLSTASFFTLTPTSSVSLNVINGRAGKGHHFYLLITNGSTNVTFTGWKWAGGTPPVLQAAGKDLIEAATFDGGTTIYGRVFSANPS